MGNALPQGKQFEKGATRLSESMDRYTEAFGGGDDSAEALNKFTDAFEDSGKTFAKSARQVGDHLQQYGPDYANAARDTSQAAMEVGQHIHDHGSKYVSAAARAGEMANQVGSHVQQHGTKYATAAKEIGKTAAHLGLHVKEHGQKYASAAEKLGNGASEVAKHVRFHGDTYAATVNQIGETATQVRFHIEKHGDMYADTAKEIQGLSKTVNMSLQDDGQMFKTMKSGQEMMDRAKSVSNYVAGAQMIQSGAQSVQAGAQVQIATDLHRMTGYAARMTVASERNNNMKEKGLLLEHIKHVETIAKAAIWHAKEVGAAAVCVSMGDTWLAAVLNETIASGEVLLPIQLQAFESLSEAIASASILDGRVLIYHHSLDAKMHGEDIVIFNCNDFVLVSDSSVEQGPRLILTGNVRFVNSTGMVKKVSLDSERIQFCDNSDVLFSGCVDLSRGNSDPTRQLESSRLFGLYELMDESKGNSFCGGDYMVHFGDLYHGKQRHRFVLLEPTSPETSANCYIVHARRLYNGESYRAIHGPEQRTSAHGGPGPGFLSAVVMEPLYAGSPFDQGVISSKVMTDVSITEDTLRVFGQQVVKSRSCHEAAVRLYRTLKPDSIGYAFHCIIRPETRFSRPVHRVRQCLEEKKENLVK